MIQIGVQTQNVIEDHCPEEGFELLKETGFSCVDFSLNGYLKNSSLYKFELSDFFDRNMTELETFFSPHKKAAETTGIRIAQMHMPYPSFIPNAPKELNDYLQQVVAPKSMRLCAFLGCPYIVVHGFKLAWFLGSEQAEWDWTERFLETLGPMAKELGITLCIENLYNNISYHIVEGPCCDARKTAERIDMLNEKHGAEILGFCFDTGHANLVGIDFEDFITTLGYRLKVLHIHDNDGRKDLHQIPFTFTQSRENKASTDWDGFMKGLRTIKYDGALSFETAPVLRAFPEPLKEETLRLIAGIGRYFAEGI